MTEVARLPASRAELPFELEYRLAKLNHRYAQCLDDGRLEEWPEFFVDDCLYKIQPRENFDAGLPLCLLYFDNKPMLRDRVLCLRDVNIYNIHVMRHYLSNIDVAPAGEGVFAMRANYLVIQSDNEGRAKIFSVGEYRDKVVLVGGELKFKEKTVIVDSYLVPSHLSLPM